MDITPIFDDALPHSLLAEQIVLGAMLGGSAQKSPDSELSFTGLVTWLSEEDFHRPAHQLVFRAIRTLDENRLPCDVVGVDGWLREQGLLHFVEHDEYLLKLLAAGEHYSDTHAHLVHDKAVMRRLHEVGKQIVRDTLNGDGKDWAAIASIAEQRIWDIAKNGTNKPDQFVPIEHALNEAYEELQTRYQNDGGITGLPTGIHELDNMTCGLQSTDLVILASRPAMGKTSLALCIAEHVSTVSQRPVAIFSMELSTAQLGMRFLSSYGLVDSMHLRSGCVVDNEWTRVANAIHGLKRGAGIFIDDTPDLTAKNIRDRTRRLKREHNLGLVIIDDLQLVRMQGSGDDRDDNPLQAIRSIKAMARELGVPVLLLSRVSRSPERRGDKRPRISDLLGAEDIADAADLILLLYRESYYHRDFPDLASAEIIVAKNREGPTGKALLKFWGEYFHFSNPNEKFLGSFE